MRSPYTGPWSWRRAPVEPLVPVVALLITSTAPRGIRLDNLVGRRHIRREVKTHRALERWYSLEMVWTESHTRYNRNRTFGPPLALAVTTGWLRLRRRPSIRAYDGDRRDGGDTCHG